jgi:hypothetical protein
MPPKATETGSSEGRRRYSVRSSRRHEERLRIWASVWANETPLVDDVEWRTLATDLWFSGAEIKNIALAATFLTAEEGTLVTAKHVRRAVRREYEKAGRAFEEGPLT